MNSDFGLCSNSWIIDSGTSHHIAIDIKNLSMLSDYGGNDEKNIYNGKSIPITHVGFTSLSYPNTTFKLVILLCALRIMKNLIFVFQFFSLRITPL